MIEPRWGITDALFALLSGIVAAAVAVVALGGSATTTEVFVVVLPAQEVATLAAAWFISRSKGSGNPWHDYRVLFRRGDAKILLVGLGLQVALSWLLTRITRVDEPPQEIARLADQASGFAAAAAFVVTVAVVPLVEEIVFRGLLLEALRRRMAVAWAVAISAAVFTLSHYTGRATLIVLPPLFVVGVVLGTAAVVTRRLGVPILIHAGFNLLPALVLLLG